MSDDTDTDDSNEVVSDAAVMLTRAEILTHAVGIAQEFADDGMDITLRQLYYQFVSRGLTGSGQKVYKRIGEVVTAARYSGEFPLDQLVDRGRDVAEGDYTRNDRNPAAALKQSAALIGSIPSMLLDIDQWHGQSTFVSVWVEKQALEGVFEPVCSELGVSWFACKGYPSVSALWKWLQRAETVCDNKRRYRNLRWPGDVLTRELHEGCAERCVVLYFGDHDPDGWEIPRSAERNIRRLMELKNIDIDLEFKRIALNMDQIRQYNPPPFEAKMTSARFAGYVKEHDTLDAWELDALNPRVLRELIRENVGEYFNERLHQRNRRALEEAKTTLMASMGTREFMQEALDTTNDDDDGGEE